MATSLRKTIITGACALGIGIMGSTALAADWEPSKPIDFIIMAGKGGGADKMARFMQAVIQENKLASKPLVPVNKAGGSGAEALVAMNGARDPDHTIMVTLNSFFTTPLRQPALNIDIMQFAPIARMAEDTFLLWVNKNEGVNSFEEFVAEAKKRGNGWIMGGTGKASEDNILTDYLNQKYGLSMKYIPYKGGGAVAKEVAGEQVDSSVNNPSEALGFYQSGDMVPLVAFTDERLALFPDVPTLKELGDDFSYYMQRAVVGAPGMSEEALAYYQELFSKVYASEKWQKYMKDQSLLGEFLVGDPLREYWKTQLDRHEAILRASGDIK